LKKKLFWLQHAAHLSEEARGRLLDSIGSGLFSEKAIILEEGLTLHVADEPMTKQEKMVLSIFPSIFKGQNAPYGREAMVKEAFIFADMIIKKSEGG